MSETRRPHRLRALVLLGLAAAALAVFIPLGLTHWRSGTEAGGAAAPAQASGVVCQGYVDVEDGVAVLNPVTPGRVVEIRVREGQQVKAGTVLLQLDGRQMAFLVRQAEGDLKAAQARLAEARRLPQQHQSDLAAQQAAVEAAAFRLSAARQLLQRHRNLFQAKMESVEETNAAADTVKELEAALQAEQDKLARLKWLDPLDQLSLAGADVEAKQARLEEARHALSECALRAPTDGEVLRLLASVGDVVPQANQPSVLFCPDRPRIVRAEVPQEFANGVAVGQVALLQDEARLAEVYRGHVSRVSDWFTQRRSVLQEPLQRNDVRTLECIVQPDPGQPPLRIGQRMRVRILGPSEAAPEGAGPVSAPSPSR